MQTKTELGPISQRIGWMTDLLTDEDFLMDEKDDDLLTEGEEFVFESEIKNSNI